MNDRFILRAQLRAVIPNGVVLHASSVAKNNRAFIFMGRSGAGKSTITNKLAQTEYGAIADDSVVISKGTDNIIRCLPCGSMKQLTDNNKIRSAELKSIYFVEKGSPGIKIQIEPEYAFFRAITTSSILALNHISKTEQEQAIAFLQKLFNTFPAYLIRYGLNDHPENFL